jgi:hypothetical protein
MSGVCAIRAIRIIAAAGAHHAVIGGCASSTTVVVHPEVSQCQRMEVMLKTLLGIAGVTPRR